MNGSQLRHATAEALSRMTVAASAHGWIIVRDALLIAPRSWRLPFAHRWRESVVATAEAAR